MFNTALVLIVVYILTGALLVFLLLFGESQTFQGTFVESAHHFITAGAWVYVHKALKRVCGERGADLVAGSFDWFLNRPNPVLQFFYLGLLFGGYFTAGHCLWSYVPGPYVAEYHSVVGPLAVMGCLVLFLLTSLSDPGVVTTENADRHLASYEFDGLIFVPKWCGTCGVQRPARSKHCSVCGHCVARMDHHCGWMNNCVGERNLRYFISFLVANCLLCWYGVFLMLGIVAGEMKLRGVFEAVFVDEGGQPLGSGALWLLYARWALVYYHYHLLVALFAGLVSILIGSFLSYHLYLVAANMTTNETFKYSSFKQWLQQQYYEEAREELAKLVVKMDGKVLGMGGEGETGKSTRLQWYGRIWRWLLRRKSPDEIRINIPKAEIKNLYDRGIWANFVEVFWPLSERREACPVEANGQSMSVTKQAQQPQRQGPSRRRKKKAA